MSTEIYSITVDGVSYDALPGGELDVTGIVYVPVMPSAGHHSVHSLDYPEIRLAVAPDLDKATRIANLAVSHAGGYGMVLVRACDDPVTHTEPATWLND